MKEKLKRVQQELWFDSINKPTNVASVAGEIFDFNQFDSLQLFKSDHPMVMKKRIEEKNWTIDLDISRKKFSLKEKLLYWYEKKTGKRLFDFRNYKVI